MKYVLIFLICFASSTFSSETKREVALSSSYKFSSPNTGKKFSQPFIDAIRSSLPAVVSIEAEGGLSYSQPDPRDFFSDDFFRHFFGAPPQRQRRPKMSQGSGFIISADGYVMTNYHVVFDAEKIRVHIQNGGNITLPATLVGADRRTDVALLKINSENGETFPYLEIGDSENLELGEWVIAAGNPYRLHSSVSAGIISFKGRQNLHISEYEDFLQHTAAINPGSSGGPLLNLNGQVVGMNTAIATQSGSHAGIGFAIPSPILINVKDQLLKKGRVHHGFLGVEVQTITPDLAEAFHLKKAEGVVVLRVVEGSVAEKAGIKEGDILIKLNGKKIKDDYSFKKSIMILPPSTEISLTINRQKKVFDLSLAIGSNSEFTSDATDLPFLKISVDNTTAENLQKYQVSGDEEGVIVVRIDRNSPAFGYLYPGDLIKSINRQPVKNVTEALKAMENVQAGEKVPLFVRQGNMVRFYSFTMNGKRK